MNFKQFTDRTVKEFKIKATELFDRNFEQQGFFDKKWQHRKNNSDPGRGILIGKGSGRLRRSLKNAVISGNTISWKLDVPYAKIHNEGGTIKTTQSVRAHTRTVKGKVQKVKAFSRNVNIKMPQRQFIGDHPQLRLELEVIATRNAKKMIEDFKAKFKK